MKMVTDGGKWDQGERGRGGNNILWVYLSKCLLNYISMLQSKNKIESKRMKKSTRYQQAELTYTISLRMSLAF